MMRPLPSRPTDVDRPTMVAFDRVISLIVANVRNPAKQRELLGAVCELQQLAADDLIAVLREERKRAG